MHIRHQTSIRKEWYVERNAIQRSEAHTCRSFQALNKMNTVCGGQNICPSDLEDAERLMTKEQKRKLIRQLPDKRIILTFNNYRLPNNEEFQYEVYPYTSSECAFIPSALQVFLIYSFDRRYCEK